METTTTLTSGEAPFPSVGDRVFDGHVSGTVTYAEYPWFSVSWDDKTISDHKVWY